MLDRQSRFYEYSRPFSIPRPSIESYSSSLLLGLQDVECGCADLREIELSSGRLGSLLKCKI